MKPIFTTQNEIELHIRQFIRHYQQNVSRQLETKYKRLYPKRYINIYLHPKRDINILLILNTNNVGGKGNFETQLD